MNKKYLTTPLVVFIRLSADDLIVTSPYNDASFNDYHGSGGRLDADEEDEDPD